MAIQSALIVDDSKLARVTLRKKLAKHGVEADLAESADEALAKIQENRPQIVFMDHLMPDMDGFEATQVIRKMPGMADLPIIMCTGKDHEGYMDEAKAVGANSTLSKPPTEDSLAAILNMDFTALFSSVQQESLVLSQQSEVETADLPMPDSEVPDVEVADINRADDLPVVTELPVEDEAEIVVSSVIPAVIDLPEIGGSLPLPETDYLPEVKPSPVEEVVETPEQQVAVSDDADVDSTALSDLLSDLLSEENLTDTMTDEIVETETLDADAITALITQQVTLQQQDLKDELVTSLTSDVKQLLASQPASMSAQDINTLVKTRIQTLWKKNAVVITESITGLKQRIDRVDASAKALASQNHPNADLQDANAKLEAFELKIDELQTELKRVKGSATIAKTVGFLAFVVSVSSVAILGASLFNFI